MAREGNVGSVVQTGLGVGTLFVWLGLAITAMVLVSWQADLVLGRDLVLGIFGPVVGMAIISFIAFLVSDGGGRGAREFVSGCVLVLTLLGGCIMATMLGFAHMSDAGRYTPQIIFLVAVAGFFPLPILLGLQRLRAIDFVMENPATAVTRDHLKEFCSVKAFLSILQFVGVVVQVMYGAPSTGVTVFLVLELVISYLLSICMAAFLYGAKENETQLAQYTSFVVFFHVLDIALGISGMVFAFAVEYDSFANEFTRAVLVLEHTLFLLFIGVRTLTYLFRPQHTQSFLLFIEAVTYLRASDADWRYSIASYPATCLAIPPLLHFSIIAIPSTIAVVNGMLADQTCEDLSRMVFVDLMLGIVGMLVALRSFVVESYADARTERHRLIWNACYLGGVIMYRFSFTLNLAEVCEGVHPDKNSAASGLLIVAALTNAAFWLILCACGIFVCRTFTTDAIEGRLWGFLGNLVYIASTASILACKQIYTLFWPWMTFFAIVTPLEVIALMICRHDGDASTCSDSAVSVHSFTIALGVLVPVLGVLAVGSVRIWRPRLFPCEQPLFIFIWHLFMILQLVSILLEITLQNPSAGWNVVFFIFQVIRFPLWCWDTFRTLQMSEIIKRVIRNARTTHSLARSVPNAGADADAAGATQGIAPTVRAMVPAPQMPGGGLTAAERASALHSRLGQRSQLGSGSRNNNNNNNNDDDDDEAIPPPPGFVRRQLSDGGTALVAASDVPGDNNDAGYEMKGGDDDDDENEIAARLEGTRPGFIRRLGRNGEIDWIPADQVLPGSPEQAEATGQPQQSTVEGWQSYSTRELAQVAQLPFEDKVEWFRRRVQHAAVPWSSGHVRLNLPRDRLLDRAVYEFDKKSVNEFRQIWRFSFTGEEGIDAGGLAREFFEITADLIFEDSGVFKHSATDSVTYQLNSGAQRAMADSQWRGLCRFAGRFMGKALFDRQIVKAHLARPFYKHLLGLSVELSDMEYIDSMVHQSLTMILQYPDDQLEDLYLPFAVMEEDVFLGVREVELRPGGSKEMLSAENKAEYVRLLFEHTMLKSISPMLSEMLQGFYSVIPFHIVSVFDFQELELLMCGLEKISVEEWRTHTAYQGSYSARHNCIRWFWEVVTSFSHEDRSRLLQYVTGTSRVPVGGFAELQGRDGGIRLFTIQSVELSQSEYPRSHTCFNRIDLPMYRNKDTMERALTSVIQLEGGGFTID